MKCPSCGNTSFRESRQCPAYKSEPVCVSCCTKCKYYDPGGMLACRWHVAHRKKEIINPDIAALSKEIEKTKSRINYYYQKGKRNAALQQEVNLRTLIAKRKELLGKS